MDLDAPTARNDLHILLNWQASAKRPSLFNAWRRLLSLVVQSWESFHSKLTMLLNCPQCTATGNGGILWFGMMVIQRTPCCHTSWQLNALSGLFWGMYETWCSYCLISSLLGCLPFSCNQMVPFWILNNVTNCYELGSFFMLLKSAFSFLSCEFWEAVTLFDFKFNKSSHRYCSSMFTVQHHHHVMFLLNLILKPTLKSI